MDLKKTMRAAGQFYTRLHLLSLDVVLGALAGASLAVKITKTKPGAAFWLVLAASVWLVYNSDHFLDGIKSGRKALNPRHLFHFRHAALIFRSILLIGTITAIIAFTYLPGSLIRFGLILGAIILIYLSLAYLSDKLNIHHLHKEYIIAAVYVAGIWAGPILVAGASPGIKISLLITINFLLALCNLLTLSYYDLETDIHDGDTSFAVAYGNKTTSFTIYLLLFIAFITSFIAILIFREPMIQVAAGIFSGMIIMQFLIFRYRNFFLLNNRFRLLGELVFLLPAFILLFP